MSEKTLAEKLLVKPGKSLFLSNVPVGFSLKSEEMPAFSKIVNSSENADVVLHFSENLINLEDSFAILFSQIKVGAICWIAYPKKSSNFHSNIDRDILRTFLLSKRWDGVSLIAIDQNWSAMRVVKK